MKHKILLAIIIMTIFAFGATGEAFADPYDVAGCLELSSESAQIGCLQDIIDQIAAQIQALLNQSWCHTFTKNLGYADSGTEEVGYLHTALQKQGFSYAPDTGNTYFEGTAKAVKAFQEKYASEILSPFGLTFGTGFTGTKTRAKLNQLYACQTSSVTTCIPNWSCGSWSTCVNNTQTRTCNDLNNCGTTANKPAIAQYCALTCTPNWSCGSWSTCANNTQTRTCNDLNNCGTTTNKPSTSQYCIPACTENWLCGDWGTCYNNIQTKICNDLNNCGTTANKPATSQYCTSTCTPKWQCGSWSTCANNTQTRICIDTNNCGVSIDMLETTRSCCSETDLGDDPYVLGTTTSKNAWNGQTGSYTDSCLNTSTLVEYYCASYQLASKNEFACTYGCLNGACLPEPDPPIMNTPLGGEILELGSSYTIDWENNLSSVYGDDWHLYDIYLESDSSQEYVIIEGNYSPTDAYSLYHWSVGDVWEGGFLTGNNIVSSSGYYTFKICRSRTDICDTGNAFLIVAPPVVTNPVAGENIEVGSSVAISWEYDAAWLYADEWNTYPYSLNLVPKNSTTLLDLAQEVYAPPNNLIYYWTVPLNAESGTYRIKICGRWYKCDYSDYFTILNSF